MMFHFTSPIDSALDRTTYFARCWPNSDVIVLDIYEVADGDRASSDIKPGYRPASATVECDGYPYFSGSSVRMEWLEKAQKTDSDRACPHSVQFYDVVIDGVRHERAAWYYESPRPRMKQVADRFGLWKNVEVS